MGIFSSVVTLCSISVSVSSSPIRDSGILLESCYVPGPVVDLGYAKYQGSTDLSTNITSFLIIRYAAPPIGSLRFQALRAPAHTSIIQNATSLPPPCYQANGGSPPTNPFVQNVILPAQQQNLPVTCAHASKVDIRYDWIGAGSMLQHVVAHPGRTDPPLFRAAMTMLI
ncbi:hypothetical protein PILCRDRAFT_329 [Piloderma croceum F 1598]|uniref:Carboxylesterase type B domain-containing protein n=1 Tax=Piloderma croceum (strain F 1598) TaxID=765440 RepID=A0A0C3C099_PILCF|nr:hypothetical protein PILCRDRAFT_329 [Piloderma croceum F 1598]